MSRVIPPMARALLGAAGILLVMLLAGVFSPGLANAGGATAKHGVHHPERHAARQHRASAAQTGTTDTAQSETPGTQTESAGESGTPEPAGDAQPAHEDPEGEEVDHQCPPDCAPGELP